MVSEAVQPRLFDDLPDRDRSPLRARWWLSALLLHGVLLMLPVAWYQAGDGSSLTDPVTVSIFEAPREAREQEIQPVEVAMPEEPPEPTAQESSEPPASPERPSAAPATAVRQPTESIADSEAPELDVQRLLETVASMDWSLPTEQRRTLGRSTESEITEALRQPVLALTDNTFDGMTAPSEVEIEDRWVSPGGEHNVVIRAPDGNTYCGRQAPVDDLRPWLQMPMLFHRCAGGGKRGSSTSWRNN